MECGKFRVNQKFVHIFRETQVVFLKKHYISLDSLTIFSFSDSLFTEDCTRFIFLMLVLRYSLLSTFLGSKLVLTSETTLPAAENTLSLKAELKGMTNYFLVICESSRIIFAWASHHHKCQCLRNQYGKDLCMPNSS